MTKELVCCVCETHFQVDSLDGEYIRRYSACKSCFTYFDGFAKWLEEITPEDVVYWRMLEEHAEQQRYLTDVHGIHGEHASCYLCNFENDYICHKYNGGCDQIEVCRKICEQEGV